MRIAIVEDHADDLRTMKELLRQYQSQHSITLEIESFSEGEILKKRLQDGERYDVYFFDVEMPKLSGMELAEFLRKKDREGYLIFVTAHLEYAPMASEYRVFRYIEKYTLQERLPKALDSIQEDIKWKKNQKNFLVEVAAGKREQIEVDNIYYIEKVQKYVTFHTKNGEKSFRTSLEQVFQRLNSEEFIYSDRSYIVNLRYVRSIEKQSLEMADGSIVPVGRLRMKKVKEQILSFWGWW